MEVTGAGPIKEHHGVSHTVMRRTSSVKQMPDVKFSERLKEANGEKVKIGSIPMMPIMCF